MSFSSDDSLTDLPLPYDISTAVSRALRINSTDGSISPDDDCKVIYPLTAVESTSHALKNQPTIEQYNRNRKRSSSSYTYENSFQSNLDQTGLHYYQPPGPLIYDQFSMDAWSDNTVTVTICSSSESMLDSQNDMEQLDQFCNYIVSNCDEELPLADSSSSAQAAATAAAAVAPVFPSNSCPRPPYHYQYQVGMDSPPRKKCRSSASSLGEYQHPTSTESSPEKGAVIPLQAAQNNRWMMTLENSPLWQQFNRIGNEMVITKGGRRMFPTPEVSVSGLDPEARYTLKMEILPLDSRRYKFLEHDWTQVGRADKKQVIREYTHPDSPNTGAFWMEKPIHFKGIKLTNSKTTVEEDQLILNSMQKYQPFLKLTCVNTGATQSFGFMETVFMAVTAYQNSDITQLKITHNPYARAFRESITADSSGAKRKGGHYKKSPRHSGRGRASSKKRVASTSHLSPTSSPKSTEALSSTSSTENKCTSQTSVESGFEGSDSGETVQQQQQDDLSFSEIQINAQPNPYMISSTSYWADDNSLWNPNLISPMSPDPLMDSTDSFSEPYLQQSTKSIFLYDELSPIKPLHDRSSSSLLDDKESSLLYDTPPIALDLETLGEDDVFL